MSSSGKMDTRNYSNSEKAGRALDQGNMQIHDTLNIFPKGKLYFIALYKHFDIFRFLAISDLLVRFVDFITVMQGGFK